MGGSSTPAGSSAGNNLSNLFMSNQATPQVATPTVAAPQSLIGQGGAMPQSTQSPVGYTPPANGNPNLPPQWADAQQRFAASHPPTFTADPNNPGYGWMKSFVSGNSGGGDMATSDGWARNYVSAPQQVPQTPFQPSSASLLAAMINQQAGRK